MKGHRLHVRRKMKGNNRNEENRGLINKKAYENHRTEFCRLSFGALSLFIIGMKDCMD